MHLSSAYHPGEKDMPSHWVVVARAASDIPEKRPSAHAQTRFPLYSETSQVEHEHSLGHLRKAGQAS